MCKCTVFSPPVFMPVGMEIPIVLFIGVFGVVMIVPVRHCMIVAMVMVGVVMVVPVRNVVAVPVVMIVMRVIMVMGMLMPFMCMSRSGLLHLPFLFLCNK